MTRLAVLGCVLGCLVFTGCGGREYTGERRYAISGKVTVDGEAIGMGVISFRPQGEGGRVAGGPIADGAYEIPEAKGPNAGLHRVEIHWNKLTGRKVPNPMDPSEMIDEMAVGLPEKFNTKSELKAEVSAGQTRFDFHLKLK
jgi:hypothetical protein